MYVTAKGDLETMKLLINAGADLDAVDYVNTYSCQLIFYYLLFYCFNSYINSFSLENLFKIIVFHVEIFQQSNNY